jgi:hypothetical protein
VVSGVFHDQERAVCDLLARAARGPQRNGLFAVWLLLRVTSDLIPQEGGPDRAHRRRVQAMEQRLRSLTLPLALRSSLDRATEILATGSADGALTALREIHQPVREALGPRAADVIREALSEAQQVVRDQP